MPYISIGIDKKKEVVKSYWAGENITNISKRFNISRDSVYTWSTMADEAITNALGQRSNNGTTKELENENIELKEKLEVVQKIYSELSQISQNIDGFRGFELTPIICSECGCPIIWKNGKYKRKGYSEKEEEKPVQRYTCSNCKANIYR
jgi:transposase-like protein